jgi:hypothetical protein
MPLDDTLRRALDGQIETVRPWSFARSAALDARCCVACGIEAAVSAVEH